MNEFDQFVKHNLRVKHYARYTDDFAMASSDKAYLENIIEPISKFLHDRLALVLHPKKISIRKLHQGIDFLGYVIFPHYRLVRNKTKRRIFKKMHKHIKDYHAGLITENSLQQSLKSYLGVLSHANAYRLSQKLRNEVWFH